MRALRLPHWRSLMSRKVFRRGLVHQLSPQREVRFRRAGHDLAVWAAENRSGSSAALQRSRAQTGHRPGTLLRCPLRDLAPGYGIFVSEMICGLKAADAALLVVDAVAGVEVQTEKAWKLCDELGLPRLVVVNRMDRENADGGRVMEQLSRKFGRTCVCLEAPIGREKSFRGVIDLVAMEGYLTDPAGKTVPGPVPEEFAKDAATLHESLVEMVAEGDDKLMEMFFAQGNLSEEQMKPALTKAIRDRRITPVLFAASGDHEPGVEKLLDEIVDLLS